MTSFPTNIISGAPRPLKGWETLGWGDEKAQRPL